MRRTEQFSRRVLAVCGLAHALHDGYTDLIYVLLPVWRMEFAVSYATLARVIAALLPAPGPPVPALLPLLGIMLNGTPAD